MNDIEIRECESVLGTSEDVTMTDYFEELSEMLGLDVDVIKVEFKKKYSDTTDWSF